MVLKKVVCSFNHAIHYLIFCFLTKAVHSAFSGSFDLRSFFLLMQKLISISVLFKCVSLQVWPVYGPARAFPHFVFKLVPLLTLHTRTLSVKLRTHHGVETGQGCFDLLPQYPFFFPQTTPEFQSPTQVRGQHW